MKKNHKTMNKETTTEKGFRFDFSEDKNGKKRHDYFWDGKRMTGVTTILRVISKDDALLNWAARMASEYVLENLKDLNDLEAVCDAAKNAHAKKKEAAGKKGTSIHEILEEIIKDAIVESEGRIEMNTHEIPQVKNFIEWSIENKVQFLASEKKVYDSELFVAGCADFVCVINGKKYIGDIKTSSGIYPEMFYQAAAYRLLLESMGEKDFDGSLIINIKKDGTFGADKDVAMRYDYQTDKDAFLAALTIYRAKQTFTQKYARKNNNN